MKEKNINQINNKLISRINKNHLNINSTSYTNKGYNKLKDNFINLKATCN